MALSAYPVPCSQLRDTPLFFIRPLHHHWHCLVEQLLHDYELPAARRHVTSQRLRPGAARSRRYNIAATHVWRNWNKKVLIAANRTTE